MSLFVVAEIGSLWEGNINLARRMIREASLAGADAIKIQLGHDPADPIRGASDKYLPQLWGETKEYGMKFGASFFSLQGLDNGRKAGLDFYKIPSQRTYADSELVAEVIKDRVTTFVSHGMTPYLHHWTIEPRFMVNHVHNVWCISEYPTPITALYKMPAMFWHDGFDGYSDHCFGIESCLLAIARGATMVETHFTLNPTNQTIRDHAFAKTPQELAELVRLGRRLNQIVEASRGV